MHKDTLLPLKRLEAAQKARKVALLETMVRDFENFVVDLAQQIATEEERTRIRDQRHVAYSTFATAAAARRRNLLASTADLRAKLDAAQHELQQATMVLRGLELAQSHMPATVQVPVRDAPAIAALPVSIENLATLTAA
jgi:flagellar protein FliJ